MDARWLPAVLAAVLAGLLPQTVGCGPTSAQGDGGATDVACRTTTIARDDAPPVTIRWVTPEDRQQRRALDRWCEGVGPIVVLTRPPLPSPSPVDDLAIVSWNVHVGGGDIDGLVHRLRAGAFTANEPVQAFVLLLQEAYRAGSLVPRVLRPFVILPDRIRPSTGRRQRQDIAVTAARLGLNLYYVPSMRNGGPLASDEDRGNAILSTEPLDDLSAIELPFERQRRVVATARIRGTTSNGRDWSLRLASVHFDNLIGVRHLWVFSGASRRRQAEGLVAALRDAGPAIVGGDFNTWWGYRDAAYRTLLEAFPDAPAHDRRPTFAGLLRLDHVFARLPHGWQASFIRLDDRFGSDHFPLFGRVTPGAGSDR